MTNVMLTISILEGEIHYDWLHILKESRFKLVFSQSKTKHKNMKYRG